MNFRKWPVCRQLIVWAAALLLFAAVITSCSPATAQLAEVLYLAWDDAGSVQLFGRPSDGGAASQYTGMDPSILGNVITFSPSPNGEMIAYSLSTSESSSAIRLLHPGTGEDELLLDCPDAECSELSWAPDNMRLAYERRDITTGTAGSPRLWWLDTASNETIPLIADDAGPTYGATFSPDGQRLAYVSPKEQGLVVVNLLDDDQQLISTETGMQPLWLSDSLSLIYSLHELTVLHEELGTNHDEHAHDFGTAVHLYHQDLSGEVLPLRLSPDSFVDDGTPTLSPDGAWIAFGRRLPETASGRQIWIMRADGTEARQLTDDTAVNHGPAMWSPDGTQLLYQRFSTTEPEAQPSIWIMDLESGEQRQLVEAGFLPRWLAGSG